MIIVLSVLFCVVFFLLFGTLAALGKLQQQVNMLDKEQHIQNKEMLDNIKFKSEVAQTLVQHTEILQYFADKDEILGRAKKYFTGPIGEA